MEKIYENQIISILKFLDVDLMDDEKYLEVCDLDINNSDEQDLIIDKIFIPEFYNMNSKDKEYIVNAFNFLLVNNHDCSSVFERISSPFDLSNIDQQEFLRKIYEKIVNK